MPRPQPYTVIQVFSKIPQHGKVKTRLIPDLGVTEATKIASKLLFNTLDTAYSLVQQYPEKFKLELWLLDSSAKNEQILDHSLVETIRLKYSINIYPQTGVTIGDKMYYTLNDGLSRYAKAILVGTDCPSIKTKHYVELENELTRSEVAIIPALDGGYVAFSCSKVSKSWFNLEKWSHKSVLEQTIMAISKNNILLNTFNKLRDLDTLEDYKWHQIHNQF